MTMMLSIIHMSSTKWCSCVLMLSLLFCSHAQCARPRDLRRSEADCSLKARIFESMRMSSMARGTNGVVGLEPWHHAIMPINRVMLETMAFRTPAHRLWVRQLSKGPPIPSSAPNPVHNGK
ncbi:hypothetical protein O6H91_05G114900 [Diphasiastrum complanatum]|uniref:Uncharacterized protein n=1 Tax=Diphasiastrum complanatum TaxID=34168 RepID=A0ACC2DS79_DIPCM|nr:hypothetical protein O6H91_05G114900 [Diphasiastrum complanatum]